MAHVQLYDLEKQPGPVEIRLVRMEALLNRLAEEQYGRRSDDTFVGDSSSHFGGSASAVGKKGASKKQSREYMVVENPPRTGPVAAPPIAAGGMGTHVNDAGRLHEQQGLAGHGAAGAGARNHVDVSSRDAAKMV